MDGIFANVFIRCVEGIEIKRLIMNAKLPCQLLKIEVIVKTERFLQHAGPVRRLQHQGTVIGDAEIALTLNIQLTQVVLHANIRPPGSQHHMHAFSARGGQRLLYRWRNLVLRIEQRAVHINCNQFNSHSSVSQWFFLMLTRFSLPC
ncbi:hypothetical protein D3C80_1609060 [compost metagenome]